MRAGTDSESDAVASGVLHLMRGMAQSVTVPMVRIRKMVMRVSDRLVPVSMSVSGVRRDGRVMFMFVLMMLVVGVFVLVLPRAVKMVVLVPLAQVQPHAHSHKRSSA